MRKFARLFYQSILCSSLDACSGSRSSRLTTYHFLILSHNCRKKKALTPKICFRHEERVREEGVDGRESARRRG